MSAYAHAGPSTVMPALPEQRSISFVVIARNEAGGIERVLKSILAQRSVTRRELIVIDDGSTDATAQRVAGLARQHPDIRLLTLRRSHGRGYARQAGIRLATGDVIATVDADVVLPPGWAEECLAALAGADAAGGTAVPDGDVAYVGSRFQLKPRVVPHTTQVTGSNAVYRRELFDRVSFDPALRDGEDVAFNHALNAINARAVTVAGLTVEHRETKSVAETIGWLHQSGRGATRQLCRYREIRGPDVAFAGWLLCTTGAAVGWRRGSRRAAGLPIAYAAIAAAAHISRAFVFERRTAHRFLGGVLLDTVLLTSYFAGRVTGLRAAVAHSRDTLR